MSLCLLDGLGLSGLAHKGTPNLGICISSCKPLSEKNKTTLNNMGMVLLKFPPNHVKPFKELFFKEGY